MVAVFFVTSSDSGSLVIDSITAGGKLDAPVGQRILWALTEGAVAIALLLGGGLKAMQTASVSTGILFLFVIFVMVYSLLKSFKRIEWKRKERYICRKSHSMKPVFFTLLTLLFMSSCVAVRFPEEIEIKIEMPENASPEQIEAVLGSLRLEMTKDQGRRVKVVVDSIPGS